MARRCGSSSRAAAETGWIEQRVSVVSSWSGLRSIERRTRPSSCPSGLLCVTAPLRDVGPRRRDRRLRIPDRAGRFRLDDETWLADVCAPLLERAPQLIGITVLADTLPVALLIGRYLRRADPGVVVAMGGPGVFGAFPGLLREFGDAVDYVCMNEGELALTDLADAIADGDAHPRIPGFWSLEPSACSSLLVESSRISTTCRCPRMTRYP